MFDLIRSLHSTPLPRAILAAVETPSSWDEAYNIGFGAGFKLGDTLALMAEVMGVEGVEQARVAGREDDISVYV